MDWTRWSRRTREYLTLDCNHLNRLIMNRTKTKAITNLTINHDAPSMMTSIPLYQRVCKTMKIKYLVKCLTYARTCVTGNGYTNEIFISHKIRRLYPKQLPLHHKCSHVYISRLLGTFDTYNQRLTETQRWLFNIATYCSRQQTFNVEVP